MKIESKEIVLKLSKEMTNEIAFATENAVIHTEEADKAYLIAMTKHEAYLKCLEFVKDAMDLELNRN